MHATKAATAALTVALSGALAAGLAGTATAGTHHTPNVTAAAPDDTKRAVQQIRTVRDLGRLAELTGTLDRVTRDEDSGSKLRREVKERVDRQVRRVLESVEQARAARTLPAKDGTVRQSSKIVNIGDAANAYRQSTSRVVTVTQHHNLPDSDATEAAEAMAARLAEVNDAAMKELGLRVERARTLPTTDSPRSPKGAITTTLIDRDTLASGDLRRHKDAVEAVGDLVEDVLDAPGGRLSREDADEHSKELSEAMNTLRQHAERADEKAAGTSSDAADARDAAMLDAETVDELEARADALLKASREGDRDRTGTEAGRLVKATANLLASMPAEEREDGVEDGERVWTGTSLSPMLR